MHLGPRQIPVLLAERVDRGVDDQAGHADAGGEPGEGEDGGVVALDVPADRVPGPPGHSGQVGLIAPDPAPAARPVAPEREGREVVGHDEVSLQGQHGGVGLGRSDEGGEGAVARAHAGEGLLELPSAHVEVPVAHHHLPGGVDAKVLHHGHEPGQGLRGAGPEPARVDVHEAAAAHPVGEAEEELDRPAPWASASSQSWSRRPRVRSRLPP